MIETIAEIFDPKTDKIVATVRNLKEYRKLRDILAIMKKAYGKKHYFRFVNVGGK